MPRHRERAATESSRQYAVRRTSHRDALLHTVCLLLVLVAPSPSAAATDLEVEAAAQQRALLQLEVNGVLHEEALVYVRGPEYWIEVDVLLRAGLRDPGGERATIDGHECVRLGSLAPRVTGVLDEATLVLKITADPALLQRRVIDLASPRPTGIQYRRDASAFLNYGGTWNSQHDHILSLESGMTFGPGLLTAYVSKSSNGFIRGPANYTIDARDRLQRWVVGDTIAATGPLGGTAQLAGLSVSRNYDLDPYFVRYPTVGLSGALSTPSTVDVYVNDRLVRRELLAPGTFDLQGLPLPVGAGSARVVMRDAFGREQEIAGSFYLSSALLAKGLHQYHYAAGVERVQSPETRWRYEGVAALMSHRAGLTESLTIGGRAEVAAGLVSGGPQAAARLGAAGEVDIAAGFSHDETGAGFAWSVGYLYTARAGTIGGSIRAATAEYVTTASRDMVDRPALDGGLTASTRVGRRASVSVSYQGRRYHGEVSRQDSIAISGSLRLTARSNAFLTASRSRIGREVTPAIFTGVTVGIGHRTTVGASAEHQTPRSNMAFEAQRAMPLGEGYGYRVHGQAGSVAALDGDARYQSRWGRYEVQHNQTDGNASTSLSAAGAVVAIGGRLFTTRPVEESFALVHVPDVARVRAFLSNQEIGRTDDHGHLLVPNLLPYYGNRLSIADEDVPLDRTVAARELTLAPPFRGGALAEFPVARQHRVAGVMQLERGATMTVPAFGRLTAQGASAPIESPLGVRGEFYLEGLGPGRHTLRVEYEETDCAVEVSVPDVDEPVADLGTITCAAR